jgi:peptidoglycan/LPS O-acetylase OafA/YrhL
MLATLVLIVGSLLYMETAADNSLTALAVAWLLVLAARMKMMAVWLSGPVSQFLGHISYSLYLVHPVVGWRFIKLLRELHGSVFTPMQAWLALGAGITVSVLSAWIMYRFVEAPSLKLCHKIRMDSPLRLNSLRNSMRNAQQSAHE